VTKEAHRRRQEKEEPALKSLFNQLVSDPRVPNEHF